MEFDSRSFQEPTKISAESDEENHPQMVATERRSRRRGAREVSSRYMSTPIAAAPSPWPVSAAAGENYIAASPNFPFFPHPPLPIAKKPHHHENSRHPSSVPSSPSSTIFRSEPFSTFSDENQTLETPFPSKASVNQRKRVVRLFNDNNTDHHHQQQQQVSFEHIKVTDSRVPSRTTRPGTPLNFLRSTNPSRNSIKRVSVQGVKSVPSTPIKEKFYASDDDCRNGYHEISSEYSSNFSEGETCSISSHGWFCDSPPLNNGRVRKVPEFRSSMPEVELMQTVSSRRSVDGGLGIGEDYSSKVSSSICNRSLSSALSSCQQHPGVNPLKLISKTPASLRPNPSAARTTWFLLPPQSQYVVLGKVRKGSNRQDDVHSLRVLNNSYLQWRFVNAKAQITASQRTTAAQKSIYGASARLSDLQNSVNTKRIELEQQKRRRALSNIFKAQMPYLEEWSILEGDQSDSLGGAIKALHDASLRVPLIGNARADIRDLNEVLSAATNTLEVLAPSVEKLMQQAEGMDIIADLARIVNIEKSLIEECGDLLLVAHDLQVKECSLRSQALQLKRSNANLMFSDKYKGVCRMTCKVYI